LRTFSIFILAVSIHFLYASEKNAKKVSFVEQMRPTLNSIIGEEWTNKMIGEEPIAPVDNSVPMPVIPKIQENATSVEVYQKKEDKIKLDPKVEETFFVNFIKEAYEVTRKQKPNDDELGKLYNVMSQGATRDGIYRSLVLDSNYTGLENAEGFAVKSGAADFAVFFYQKYANKKIEKEKFKGWNTYSLKRVMTEKSLEIIDTYGDDRASIENWYANLSSDLATKFQQTMNNKLRQNQSAKYHKAWAEKAPIQHIKSEVIIKLHTALNSLM
jgi:hypothetical protein